MTPRPMNTAPRDGSEIQVLFANTWWPVTYWDCEWMRVDPESEFITDAWAIRDADGPGCVELDEAEGWLHMNEQPDHG